MSEQEKKADVRCTIRYDGEMKRKHRYLVESSEGIVGSIYIPKNLDPIPDVLILEKRKDEDEQS
jgi:hypothetical protein